MTVNASSQTNAIETVYSVMIVYHVQHVVLVVIEVIATTVVLRPRRVSRTVPIGLVTVGGR